MVSWDNTRGGGKADKRVIERLEVKNDVRIRLIGEVLPRYVYWVVTKEGRKMPVECLQFNRDTESFNESAKDPMRELSAEIYSEKPQFAYVCNVLDRSDNKIKIFDLKATIYKQIVDYARNPEYGNPADLDRGYDITIKKEKTGPLPQNVKYNCVPARSSKPLTEQERSLELYSLDKILKRPTYDEQKKWLLDNTVYFTAMTDDSLAPEGVDDIN